MERTTILSIITLIECPTAILCSCYTLFIFTGMMFASLYSKSSKSLKFSLSMQIYAALQIILAILTMFYMMYLSVLWRFGHSIYNPYWLYFTGGIQNSFLIITSLAVCTLGVDRCLLVKYPTKHLAFIPLIMFIVMAIIWSGVNVAFRMIPVYPKNLIDKRDCGNFGCLGTYQTNGVYGILRFCTGGMNITVGIVLAILLKQTKLHNTFITKSSKIALMTIIMTFVFDLLPHLLMIVIYQAFQVNLGDYTGPYSSVIGAVEAAVCALCYRNTFKLNRRCLSPMIVSPQATTNVATIDVVVGHSHSHNHNNHGTVACQIQK